MKRIVIAIAIATFGLTGCNIVEAGLVDRIATEAPSVRPPQQIFISMDYAAPFDAQAGDTVNVIMEPDAADPQGFCDSRGGSLWMNPFTNILICEGIDF